MQNQNNGQQVTVSGKTQHDVLTEVKAKPDLILEGELSVSDYVLDAPLSQITTEEVADWSNKQREDTRTNLAMWLVKLFGFSLVGTVLMIGAAAFVPTADKSFIKDSIPLVITPQVTLLGVALTFYFTSKEEK